jgi:hypothetical protein
MVEDSIDQVALGGVDEADDLHAAAAAGAGQGIDLPDAFDEGGPASAGDVARCVVVFDIDGLVLVGVGLGPPAAGLVGVEAEVADQVLAGLRHVLGDFGDGTSP